MSTTETTSATTATTATTTVDTPLFDAAAFCRAAQERDATALLAMYADDAEIEIVDREAQPSRPRIVTGRDQIGDYLHDLCGRDMVHRVDRFVLGADGAAYLESCAYPDGTAVRCAAVLDLRDGRIARQSGVQAWDA